MNIENGVDENTKRTDGFWKVRYTQALLICSCLCSAYIVRTSTSVVVIAMTRNSTIADVQIYDWDKEVQDYIISSFSWLYLFMQIPSGQLAARFGGKRFLAFSIVSNGIISLSMPISANIGGWKAVCVLRAMQGFCQGFVIPSIHTLLGKWAPFSERNRMGNIVYSGSQLGQIIAMSGSGFIATTKYGWPLVYYLIGGLCITTGILFTIYGADSPSSHKSISDEEKEFIMISFGQKKQTKVSNVPLRHIFKSIPWYATVIAHIGAVWGFYLMMTETPSFLTNVMKLDVAQSGFMSSIPYIASWITSISVSYLADYLINNNILKLVTLRKIANTIGTWGPAAGMIILTYIPEQHFLLAMSVIIMIVALDSVNLTGFFMNHIDLSPNFVGILVSMANCLSSGISSFAPITAGWILNNDPSDIKSWRLLFFVAAGVYFVTNMIFIIFAKADRQPWDDLLENPSDKADMSLIENKTAKKIVI